ncbi:hypothetical protein ES703_42606 [subsurface metagenome]
MTETRTKSQPLPLRLNSRVRVRAIVIWAMDSQSTRDLYLKCLNATGTVISVDPRWTLAYCVKLDNGNTLRFAENYLEVLEP